MRSGAGEQEQVIAVLNADDMENANILAQLEALEDAQDRSNSVPSRHSSSSAAAAAERAAALAAKYGPLQTTSAPQPRRSKWGR